MDWGTFPDYLSGIGTVGTLAVALVLLKQELDGRRDTEAAQARLVTVYAAPMATGNVVTVKVTNHSSEPIIGLEIDEVVLTDNVRWRVPPTVMGARSSATVVGAGQTLAIPVEFVNDAGERQVINPPVEFSVRYSFHDARGLTWSRVGGRPPVRVLSSRDGWWRRVMALTRRRSS